MRKSLAELKAEHGHLLEMAEACNQAYDLLSPFVDNREGGWGLRRLARKLLAKQWNFSNLAGKVTREINSREIPDVSSGSLDPPEQEIGIFD